MTGLGRANLLLGGVLLASGVHHVIVQWSALSGREAWVDRVGPDGSRAFGTAFLVGLLFYVGTGVAARLQQQNPLRFDAMGWVRIVVAMLALVFVAAHAGQAWLPGVGPHTSVRARYEQLWVTSGQLPYLIGYILGLSACCMHAALTIDRAVGRVPKLAVGRARAVIRAGTGALMMLAWGALLHLLGHFALGDGLLPMGQVVDRVAPRVGEPVPLGGKVPAAGPGSDRSRQSNR